MDFSSMTSPMFFELMITTAICENELRKLFMPYPEENFICFKLLYDGCRWHSVVSA